MTVALTPTISASPAGPVLPGQTVTTTFELLNGTGGDTGIITLTFTDTNGSEWDLNWTTNTTDAVDATSGSAGPSNAGGTTPYSPSTISTQISAGKNFSGTITSVVPLTWTSGDYTAQIVASGAGLTAPQTLSASVHVIEDVLSIGLQQTAEISQGANIVPVAIIASGGQTPYTFSATGLPPGLSVNSSTGIVSGIPTVQGDYTTTYTVTDSYSETISTSIEIHVLPNADIILQDPEFVPPNNQMTCPMQQFWQVGVLIVPVQAAINPANDLTSPIVFSAIGLPIGISLDSSTGILSGTPVVPQTSTPIVITATDNNGVVENCGFEFVITGSGTAEEYQRNIPILRQSLPTCLAIGGAGGIPVQPTIETIFTDSAATMTAVYPQS